MQSWYQKYTWKILLLGGLTVVAHAWNLRGDFIYDDFSYIVLNPEIQKGLADWLRFLLHPETYSWLKTVHYRPLTALSYAANVSMGWGIFGFKLTQLLMHLATVLGLFWVVTLLARELGSRVPKGTPWVAAALFATMPFNTEAVHYMTARSSVMCGMFVVLAVGLFLRMRQSHGRAALGFYLGHLIALGAALLCKETALTVPGVLFLADWLLVGGGITAGAWRRPRWWLPYLPYVAALSVALVVMPNVSSIGFHLSRVLGDDWRLPAAFFCLVENVRLMLVPVGLTVSHPIDRSIGWIHPLTLGCVSVVVVMLSAAWWTRFRWPLVSFGLLWYFLLIAPSTFVHLNVVLLENRGYSASMGIALVVGFLFCRIWQMGLQQRRAAGAVALLLLGVFMVVGAVRQDVLADRIKLWEDAVAKDPASDEAALNLGVRYALEGRVPEAEKIFTRLVTKSPDWSSARNNLARVLLMQKRYADAALLLEPLVAREPKNPDPVAHLSEAYLGSGRLVEALDALRQAIVAEQENLTSLAYVHEVIPGKLPTQMLELALRLNRVEDARWALQRFLEVFPDHPRQYLLAMQINAYLHDWERAEANFSALERGLPGDPRLTGWREQLTLLKGRGR